MTVGGQAAQGWPALAKVQLQQQGVKIFTRVGADTGSGYVSSGDNVGVFADQVKDLVAQNTKLVVLFGSINEVETPANELSTAVRHTLTEVQTAAPAARVLVIGPAPVPAAPPPELPPVRDVVKAGAQAVGATFVDPIVAGWFADQPDLIGSDGTNPTAAGQAYLAGKIAPLIAQQLQSPAPDLVIAPR